MHSHDMLEGVRQQAYSDIPQARTQEGIAALFLFNGRSYQITRLNGRVEHTENLGNYSPAGYGHLGQLITKHDIRAIVDTSGNFDPNELFSLRVERGRIFRREDNVPIMIYQPRTT